MPLQNGRIFDALSLKLLWPTGMATLLEDIEYGDEQEKEQINDFYNNPAGVARGSYKADCKITVGMSEYEQMNTFSASFGGLYSMPPMPVIVEYLNDSGIAVTDVIQIVFMKRSKSVKKGDKAINVTLECLVTAPIIWNGITPFAPMNG
jgi:hypothetical protein